MARDRLQICKIWDVTKNALFVAQRDSALYYGSWLYEYNLIVSFENFV